jgi:sterol desaturase/sphingolipid hydroxylase (fatty acid hydroxylase superfamily)
MKPNNDIGSKMEYGSRDARGHWKPPYPARHAPLFEWPSRPQTLLTWFIGFPGLLWPVNLFFLLCASLTLKFFQPAIETSKTLEFGWIGMMLFRNFIFLLVVYGGLHLAYYTFKFSGAERKYNPSFQQESKRQFLFGKQVLDNLFRSLVFGLPIWTAYEVLYVWAAANGNIPYLSFDDNPVGFIVWFFLILFVRETHFYFTHRLIHWGLLFKYVHSVHHLNPNPGPWTGLAMHPVEHIIYFSSALIHFIIPTNPLHFFFHIQLLALIPAVGHLGFEGPLVNGKPLTSDYFHYLHHKYVNCNFGTTIVPWDKWLGVYYNGEGEYRPRRKPVPLIANEG